MLSNLNEQETMYILIFPYMYGNNKQHHEMSELKKVYG